MRLEVIPWKGDGTPSEAVLQRQLEDEGFDVFRWRDEVGADYQPHSHDHDESIWVVEGEMVFNVAGSALRLRVGDRLMLPKGTVHSAHPGSSGATYLIGEKA
jgi:quercetin dioxygenase-like cupin family protein